MKYDHHLMAKTCSDAVLSNLRNGTWSSNVISNHLRSVNSQSSFPSPDATFFDDTNKRLIGFEFKPPSETKRGMLTAIGQASAYLNNCNISYILCPETVDGFNISNYFKSLFNDHFYGKLPIGLIKYKNDNPMDIEELVEVEPTTVLTKKINPKSISDRYWAKHQDLPTVVLYELLNIAYKLPDNTNRKHLVWKKVWEKIIFNNKFLSSLDVDKPNIFYHYGTPFQLGVKKKATLKKKVEQGELSLTNALKDLKYWADPDRKGDCHSESYKKNFMTFLGHLNLWDDACRLTPSGYDLHKVGKIYGPNSKIFIDALLKKVLFDGKHLDLILDFLEFSKQNREKSLTELNSKFTAHYASQGKIKFNNTRRQKDAQNEQFRFEQIFWRKYGLLGNEYYENGPIDFNLREIMRICTSDI